MALNSEIIDISSDDAEESLLGNLNDDRAEMSARCDRPITHGRVLSRFLTVEVVPADCEAGGDERPSAFSAILSPEFRM